MRVTHGPPSRKPCVGCAQRLTKRLGGQLPERRCASDPEGVARIRFCATCGVRLPRSATARRRYCDGACRAQAYRDRQMSDRILGLALMLGEAEWNGDLGMIRILTCPECRQITFAGAGRRRDTVYLFRALPVTRLAPPRGPPRPLRDVQPSRIRAVPAGMTAPRHAQNAFLTAGSLAKSDRFVRAV